LKFDEFEGKMNKVIAVSATPAKYEIEKSSNIPEKFFSYDPARDGVWQASAENRIIPQIMRPTGLLDPEIELRPMEFMVDDIMKNISEVVKKNERILITTITKRSSEELTEYLLDN
jgi:uvrABC system protein B